MTSDSEQSTVKLLYFARLSEQLGMREENLTLPEDVKTLGALRHWLMARGGAWTALADNTVRSAVNQQITKQDVPLNTGDEIAFFPPVTGG